jgi:hypothetical protein
MNQTEKTISAICESLLEKTGDATFSVLAQFALENILDKYIRMPDYTITQNSPHHPKNKDKNVLWDRWFIGFYRKDQIFIIDKKFNVVEITPDFLISLGKNYVILEPKMPMQCEKIYNVCDETDTLKAKYLKHKQKKFY